MRFVRSDIHRWIGTTHRWERLLGENPSRASSLVKNTRSLAYLQWSLHHWKALSHRKHARAKLVMVRRTDGFRQTVNHWRMVMGKPPVRELSDGGNVEAGLVKWRRQSNEILDAVREMVDINAFSCIHHYEGAWNANTGNGYYGGLQMDRKFQSLYGAYLVRTKGTANNWTPLEQMLVGQIAHDSGRGFYPWPNTARACGLI